MDNPSRRSPGVVGLKKMLFYEHFYQILARSKFSEEVGRAKNQEEKNEI